MKAMGRITEALARARSEGRVGLITYVYEGGEALVTSRHHGVPAGVRIFPVALIIATFFVILSRLAGFQAPIMYGFVAAATALIPAELRKDQTAKAVFVPAVILLSVSIGAWLLVGPLRDWSGNSNDWYSVLPGETAALIFVGGIEGLAFAMLPVRFLDGFKVGVWNRLVWLVLLLVPMFFFAWAILNPAAHAFDAVVQRRVVLAIVLVGIYAALAVLVWAYFYLLHRARTAHAT